ncbi:MAG: 3-hydroxyacyl-CoA dehydrogenase NAD-binding domain-containing protein [Planctomycetia bacterium]|nr:3-hydroxyacyl-CoA dehydrogenase NAD-binding domain-containing protein [Planctomycetia bacterium]
MALPESLLFHPELRHPSGLTGEEYIKRSLNRCTASENDDRLKLGRNVAGEGQVAIAGAGLMGISIAAAFLGAGFHVLLYDVAEEALRTAPDRLQKELALQSPDTNFVEVQSGRFRTTHLLADLHACPVLIETIVEKLKIKQKFYAALDDVVLPGTLLLSNTSTIEINRLAEALNSCRHLSPEHFCGFHFFHPVRRRALLEIIRGTHTNEVTLALAKRLAISIAKLPITVNDGPGFLVNRLLNPCLNESLALLEEGFPLLRIENVCRRFGMEVGPFRIMDEIGLDVALHSGWSIATRFPDRVTAHTILPTMVRAERFGRKRGGGFYRYDKTATFWEDEGIFDDSLTDFLNANGIKLAKPECPDEEMDAEIATRILLAILLEAGRLVQDGIVSDFSAVDIALTCGLGFSKPRGGLCYWADCVGLNRLLEAAEPYKHLGTRYTIPEILRAKDQTNEPLIKMS